jgi:hypothetical protein
VLTEAWIERLRNFSHTQGVQELACVRIPGPGVVEKGVND